MKVKICGITRPEDARLAAALGASAIGLMFWPGSPRLVSLEKARAILASLPPLVATVGVFVNQSLDEVNRVAAALDLDAVQLHGDESESYCAQVSRPVIKAVAVDSSLEPSKLRGFPSATLLLDVWDPVRRGGTGSTIDWTIAARAAVARPIILAGGLSGENVVEAVRAVRPYAVDVSSGVESSPGVKDPSRLEAFFQAIDAI